MDDFHYMVYSLFVNTIIIIFYVYEIIITLQLIVINKNKKINIL